MACYPVPCRPRRFACWTLTVFQPGMCETTPGVKSYSGYVHLPPNSIDEHGESQDYPINMYALSLIVDEYPIDHLQILLVF